MININLLPWREHKRERNRKIFFITLLGVTIIFIFFAGIVHVRLNQLINNQNDRNNYLISEIRSSEAKNEQIKSLKKYQQDIIAQMAVAQQLKENRLVVVKLFNVLSAIFPDGIYVNSITMDNKNLMIVGQAENYAIIVKLMRNIDDSSILENPKLEKVVMMANDFPYQFFITTAVKTSRK